MTSATTSQTHEIVVLGGNFAGTNVAHYVLKHTLPALRALDSSRSYRVTMVTPSTHFFFKVGAPRVLVQPSSIDPDSKEPVLVALDKAFAAYPADQFQLINGAATGLDPTTRTVEVTLVGAKEAGKVQQHYDSLVVATGSTSSSPLWTLHSGHAATVAAMQGVHAALPNAKTILIAGGGPVGVESAGELAQHHPDAKIALLSGADRVLTRLSTSTSAKAGKMLRTAGVEVLHNVKVESVQSAVAGKDAEADPKVLKLSNGETRNVDLYLDATGMRPNTGFLPADWLDERGRVIVDGGLLRGTVPSMDGRVYALGDVGSYSSMGIMDVMFGTKPVVRSLGADLVKTLAEDKQKGAKGKPFEPAKFWTMRDSQFVPVGSKVGVGQILGWGLPSFAVTMFKGKNYMIPQAASRMDGSEVKSA